MLHMVLCFFFFTAHHCLSFPLCSLRHILALFLRLCLKWLNCYMLFPASLLPTVTSPLNSFITDEVWQLMSLSCLLMLISFTWSCHILQSLEMISSASVAHLWFSPYTFLFCPSPGSLGKLLTSFFLFHTGYRVFYYCCY